MSCLNDYLLSPLFLSSSYLVIIKDNYPALLALSCKHMRMIFNGAKNKTLFEPILTILTAQ